MLVGFGLLVVLAGPVGLLAEDRPRLPVLRVDDVFVASSPGAQVPHSDPETLSVRPVCNATPSTGQAAVAYRVRQSEVWSTLEFGLCRRPVYRPGGVSLLLRSPDGADLDAVIPVGGWIPLQRWAGADAQIGLTLPGGSVWRALDSTLPCRIRTTHLRRFSTPIASFQGEPVKGGSVLVGATVQATFDCSGLPAFERGGAPIDLRGEVTVRNCEGVRSVIPPPALPTDCEKG